MQALVRGLLVVLVFALVPGAAAQAAVTARSEDPMATPSDPLRYWSS